MKQMAVRPLGGAVALGLCILLCASCGTAAREGRAASYLTIDLLAGASGAQPGTFSGVLQSDVITNVKVSGGGSAPTIFEDPGQVTLHIGMKDPNWPVNPTANNEITLTSYHVTFVRADGRNTPGVDVPYAFDGAITGTIKQGLTSLFTFTLVRGQSKVEPPLMALRGMGGALMISTIAQVTFYGHDQAGNQVSVIGNISVNFADWGDPQ